MIGIREASIQPISQLYGFCDCFVHFPVSSNNCFSHSYLLVSAAIPGRFFPSMNSRLAPPPVDICVILSSRLNFATAAAVSPPPMIEVVFSWPINSAISRVPLLKAGVSKIPSGPFQTMVLAGFNFSLNSAVVLGPISTAILPSGIFSPVISVFASAVILSTTIWSIGSKIYLFKFLALFKSSLAKSSLSFSNFEFPMDLPCAFKNV